MSVKENIIVKLQRALEGIKRSNGYSMDVRFVTRSLLTVADLVPEKIPLIQIWHTDKETPGEAYGDLRMTTMTPVLNCAVRAKKDVEVDSTSFQADIIKCLNAIDFGPYVKYFSIGALDASAGDGAVDFGLELEIAYLYPENNP